MLDSEWLVFFVCFFFLLTFSLHTPPPTTRAKVEKKCLEGVGFGDSSVLKVLAVKQEFETSGKAECGDTHLKGQRRRVGKSSLASLA